MEPAKAPESTATERAEWKRDLTPEELELHGMRSAAEGGNLFCGVSEEQFAIAGVTYQWPRGSKLSWGLTFSRLNHLSDMDVKDVVTAAMKEISDCCDITHVYVKNPNAANIYIMLQRLDGASGVLADCEIPVGNVSADMTRLRLRLDDAENWVVSDSPSQGSIDLYRVVLHELEHGHGLGHKPASVDEAALIAPIYSRTLRNLQTADKVELVRRYGPPRVAPPPVPPPTPGAKPVTVTVEQDGKKWTGTLPRMS